MSSLESAVERFAVDVERARDSAVADRTAVRSLADVLARLRVARNVRYLTTTPSLEPSRPAQGGNNAPSFRAKPIDLRPRDADVQEDDDDDDDDDEIDSEAEDLLDMREDYVQALAEVSSAFTRAIIETEELLATERPNLAAETLAAARTSLDEARANFSQRLRACTRRIDARSSIEDIAQCVGDLQASVAGARDAERVFRTAVLALTADNAPGARVLDVDRFRCADGTRVPDDLREWYAVDDGSVKRIVCIDDAPSRDARDDARDAFAPGTALANGFVIRRRSGRFIGIARDDGGGRAEQRRAATRSGRRVARDVRTIAAREIAETLVAEPALDAVVQEVASEFDNADDQVETVRAVRLYDELADSATDSSTAAYTFAEALALGSISLDALRVAASATRAVATAGASAVAQGARWAIAAYQAKSSAPLDEQTKRIDEIADSGTQPPSVAAPMNAGRKRAAAERSIEITRDLYRRRLV